MLEPIKYQVNLAETIKKYNILEKISSKLQREFNLTLHIGAEIEFYIMGKNIDNIIMHLQEKTGYEIKTEKGNNQFEINFLPTQNPDHCAEEINNLRSSIKQITKNLGAIADFSSKPYPNDFGSALHIHLSFEEDSNSEKYAEILCHFMPYSLAFFLPNFDDFKRLDKNYMAPTHISYGGNNRTTAIRIPDALPRRLEHRLAGANADPYMVLYAILHSILQGVRNPSQITSVPKIYGNAFDTQYSMKPINPNLDLYSALD